MKRFYLLLCLGAVLSPSFGQITIDGNITELDWGTPLSEVNGTSAAPVDGFGADYEITAMYANYDGSVLKFATAGQVLSGNSIIIFVDGVAGGYTDCNFGRFDAPQGINNINSGITFDPGFTPEFAYCVENFGGTYFWNNYTLSGTAGSGGGPKTFIGDGNNESFFAQSAGIEIGTNPTGGGSKTQGFEISIPVTALSAPPGAEVRLMAMLISNGGFLSNQFLTPANLGEGDFGGNAFDFGASSPNFVTYTVPTFPVELFDFSGQFESNGVALTWTAAEEAFSHYEVERLSASGSFEKIDHVAAQGEPGQPTSYQYLDRNAPLGQTLSYRLAMVDMDGSVDYSNQIEVSSAEGLVSISPNPTYGQLTVALPGTPRNPGTIQVMNMQGQTVYSQPLSEGQSVWNLDLSDLASGAYQAVIMWDNQRTVKRFSLY